MVTGIINVSGSATPTIQQQGAYVGWNALTGGYGETDFINAQGGGPGGFAFMKANSNGTLTTLDFIDGGGNFKFSQGSGASMTFADGTVQSTAWNGVLTGGDYAESVNVSGNREEYEPGDVLVIDPGSEGKFLRSSAPYSTAVTGIYSTRPGVIGRRQRTARAHMKEEVPMAMTGIVPTKVSAENGPIKPGDLLVTSSRPGYAMKGTDRSQMLGAQTTRLLLEQQQEPPVMPYRIFHV